MIVVNGADERLRDHIRGDADANGFPPIPAGADDSRFRVEDDIVFCSDDPLFPRSVLRLRGAHNGRNLCVALAVLDGLGVDVLARKDELREAVASFEGLPHRLTEIQDQSGLIFVDDTLSTSPYATIHAIDAYAGRPLTVLVGGQDRGVDYGPLREFLAERELTVIGMPDSGTRILGELAGLPGIRTENAVDLPAAVRLSRKLTPEGGVVLLSPGAPSYGQYRNFEHRSEVFLKAIQDSAQ
jgi:UDP-N-acetylmuramoylalanine-D-glutamate ligase